MAQRSAQAGGIFFTIFIIAGLILGIVLGNPMNGVLGGTLLGGAAALLLWLLHGRR